jgi:hypothetical protein
MGVAKALPSQDRLKGMFDYCPESGNITWKYQSHQRKGWNTRYSGKVAGSVNKGGYINIFFDRRPHLAHRIIFVILYGSCPENIDHINGIPNDNRLVNIRASTIRLNARNRTLSSSNTSGHAGVIWVEKRQRFMPRIKINGKLHYLGSHKELEHAVAARKAAELKFGFTSRGNKL